MELRSEAGLVGSGPVPTEAGAAEWLLPLEGLGPGDYELSLRDDPASVTFSVEPEFPPGVGGSAGERSGEINLRVVDPRPSTLEGASVWPVRAAVVLPRGEVRSPSELTLQRGDRAIPAQVEVLSYWSADCSSVRWVGLDFLLEPGERRDGKVRLLWGLPVDAEPGAVATEGTNPSLVPRKEWGEPYTLDAAGRRYRPEAGAEWRIESAGPVRTTYAREGWLVDSKGRRHARFSTHLSEFAPAGSTSGAPGAGVRELARVRQRFVLTPETLELGLRDAGFEAEVQGGHLPAPSGLDRVRARWRASADGEVFEGAAPVFLHQDRPDRCRVALESTVAVRERCDGWISVERGKGELLVTLPGMSERYPKELEWTGSAVVAHLWPGHGGRAYTEAEELRRSAIHEARFAHQGEVLNLELPEAYANELRRLHLAPGRDRGWDAEATLDRALGVERAGVGMALSADLWLHRLPSSAPSEELQALASRSAAPAHAIQASAILAATGGATELDPEVETGAVERLLTDALPAYRRHLQRTKRDHGQWTYPGFHNGWDPERSVPPLHRVWQASHYRNVSGAWLLYCRSGDPGLLGWAREASRQFRDVHVLHHPTEHDPIGAMDHCEGFLPWAARSSIWGHWIDADALRYRWLLLGDEVSGELYRDWGRALIDARMHLGADREGVTTLGELVAYYRQTHDPRALVSIAEWSESVLSRPFEEYRQPASFPSWHREWMARLAELRRDPRIVERARRLLDAGYGDAATVAFVARADGAHGRDASAHRERIERELERLEGLALQRFDSPGDPLDGYGPWWANRSAVPLYTAPYLLDAAREFGIAVGGRGGVETYYPAAATYSVERGRGRGPGLEVWIEDVRDSELELRIRRPPGYGDLGAISYRVLAPSGREIASATAPGEAAADEIVLRLPPDGESGLYRFECRGHRCGLAAPISDAPEGAALTPGSVYRAAGRGDFRLTAPAGGPLGLRLAASPGVTPAHPQTATPAWFEVGSAGSNEPLRSGSLFAYGEPSSMTLDLRPTAVAVEGRPGGGPSLPAHWALSTASRFGPSIEVLGDAPFVLLTSGRRPTKDAESIGERAVEAGLVPSRPNAPPPRRPTKR